MNTTPKSGNDEVRHDPDALSDDEAAVAAAAVAVLSAVAAAGPVARGASAWKWAVGGVRSYTPGIQGVNAAGTGRFVVRTRGGTAVDAVVESIASDRVRVRVQGSRIDLGRAEVAGGTALVLPSGRVVVPRPGPLGPVTEVQTDGRALRVVRDGGAVTATLAPAPDAGRVRARMPGRVVKVMVAAGDLVTSGQGLLVIEAMKMQDEVRSAVAGKVAQVGVANGDRVERGAFLVEIR